MDHATYQGAELPGTTVFTIQRSARGYRLNKFAMSLSDPANRERFLAGEPAYMAQYGLTPEEQSLVTKRDWAGLVAAGGSIYVLLKIAGTVGQNLLQMGAQMRGESFDAFMKNRPFHRGEAQPRNA